MKLRHYATVYSVYDFVDVVDEDEAVERWTYLVYLNEECSHAIEIELDVHHEPVRKIELVRVTTVQYNTHIEPCLLCGTTSMEISSEFEAEKDKDDDEYRFLHECGLEKDDVLDLAIEVYLDDNFKDFITKEYFKDTFIIEKQYGNHVVLYDTYSSNRYVMKNGKVYHFHEHGVTPGECPFCESKELTLHNEEGAWMKCSVLSKNVQYLKKIIKEINKQVL